MIDKVKGIVKDFTSHWSKPADGKYVPYKEVVAYSVGGMGVQFIAAVFGQFQMSAACMMMGAYYQLSPTTMMIIATIATVVSLVFQPLKSAMIDNTQSKKGKARPYIFWLGPPSAVLLILTAFVPKAWGTTAITIILGSLYVLLNVIYNFYFGMYGQLGQLLTPNTDERASIISLSSVVFSLAPTITGALYPLIGKLFAKDGGLRSIWPYRILFPILCLVGLAIGYIAYFGTKERIVVSKQYKVKVKFVDGFKKILRNKYFWITNVSTWFLFARGAAGSILSWSYVYTLQNDNIYALLTLLMGTASLVGMLVAPILMKTIGKRWTQISTNGLMGVAAIFFLIAPGNFWLIFPAFYVFNAAAAVQIISTPAMNADALDYQQWKTGDRLEGFAGNFGIINSLIMLGTGLVIPIINEMYGLVNDYDVLFVPEIRDPMYRTLAIISVVGAVAALIPFFFWTMTNKQHKQMIEDLKQRAVAEDQAAGIVETEEELDARLKGMTVAELRKEKLDAGSLTQEEYDELFANDLVIANNELDKVEIDGSVTAVQANADDLDIVATADEVQIIADAEEDIKQAEQAEEDAAPKKGKKGSKKAKLEDKEDENLEADTNADKDEEAHDEK